MSKKIEEERKFSPLTDEVAQDAYDSWNMLAARLDMLPDGARQYFERVCAAVHDYDPDEDSELVLFNHLENAEVRSKIEVKERKRLGWKSKHDYAHIFDWVQDWRKKESVGLEEALHDYVEIHGLETNEFDAIWRAYRIARNARLDKVP